MASGHWVGIPQTSVVEQSLNWFGRTGSGLSVWKNCEQHRWHAGFREWLYTPGMGHSIKKPLGVGWHESQPHRRGSV